MIISANLAKLHSKTVLSFLSVSIVRIVGKNIRFVINARKIKGITILKIIYSSHPCLQFPEKIIG